ncbi:IS66 family insertion sequence element accessory protein TnpA [Cupriavidus sp. D39]|uniref:IS66 family insertion sequence element accessory protein TnpA n=1 Tax=Cupriavidus sp. D39 TaxID=2997877 RepID=UPI003B6374DF
MRAFCRQHGLAVSTFGLWRKRLSQEQQLPVAPRMAVTADTAFIAAATVAVPNVLPTSDSALSRSRDQVVVTLGGARIEMAGVHAERIVRFVLGQLGGGRC